MGRPATAAVRLLAGEREPVRASTGVNVILAGLQTIDGVVLAVNDRVLLRGQTDPRENGIYTASAGIWQRASDASFSRAITEGVTVQVQEGSLNGGKAYRFRNQSPRIGTDPVVVDFYLSANFAEDAAGEISTLKEDLSVFRSQSEAEFSDFLNGQIEQGRLIVGFRYRGEWASSTGYVLNDVVNFGGSLYAATGSSTGLSPSAGIGWRIFLPGGPVGDGAVTRPKIDVSVYSSEAEARSGQTTVGAINPLRLTQHLQEHGWISVKSAGVPTDGISDAAPSLQVLLDFLETQGGGKLIVPQGCLLRVDSDLILGRNIGIEGTAAPQGSYYGEAINYYRPKILLAASATIRVKTAGFVRNLVIQRQGISWPMPVAELVNYAGVAITPWKHGADRKFENLLILGFNWAIRWPDDTEQSGREHITRVGLDCNNGVRLRHSYDVSYLDRLHGWPYLTGQTGTTADAYRPGVFIQLDGVNDWTDVFRCFSYAYRGGCLILGDPEGPGAVGPSNWTLLNCRFDHLPERVKDGSYGVAVGGHVVEGRIIGLQVAAKDNGLTLDSTAEGNDILVMASNFWECDSNSIYLLNGRTQIIGCHMRGRTDSRGVLALDSITAAVLSNNTFRHLQEGVVGQSPNARVQMDDTNIIDGTVEVPVANSWLPSVQSAAAVNLPARAETIRVLGNAAITTMTSPSQRFGLRRTLVFEVALTLIHSASGANTFNLGGANRSVAAGSALTFIQNSFGQWAVI